MDRGLAFAQQREMEVRPHLFLAMYLKAFKGSVEKELTY